MKRRDFLKSVSGCTAALTLFQLDSLLAATGFHGDGPYNGPLLTSFVNSTCGACPGGCGIRVRKVDGLPIKVDGNPIHPINRGGLCPVGASSLALLVHPDRIRQPLRRSGPRGYGEFSPISWDEAEALVVEKLSELQQAGTPEQLLFVDSRGSGPAMELARSFTSDFGSPNYYNSEEPASRVAAAVWGGDGTAVDYDLENARVIFSFGSPIFEGGDNPVYYAGLRGRLLEKAEGQRGSFVVIDARLSASAAKAERWVPIKPGTQGLLALGMIYLIIKEQLYDEDFVQSHGAGFEDEKGPGGKTIEGFKSFVLKNYYPAIVSERTGVPLDQIITLARQFAGTPGAVAISGRGVHQTIDGVYQSWAIAALNVLAGGKGNRAGLRAHRQLPFRKRRHGEVATQPLISESAKQFPYLDGEGAIESLPDRILGGTPYPITVAILNNADITYESPQANRFRQALQNVPFSVALTSIQTETSLLADLILPDCTFLEKYDLVIPESDFSHPVAGLMQPVVDPLYESRPSGDILLALGRTLLGGDWNSWENYKAYVNGKARELYESNAGSVFSDQFLVSFESLLAERGWRRTEYRDFDEFWTQLEQSGGWWDSLPTTTSSSSRFPSASGKFYFISKSLASRYSASEDILEDVLASAGLEPPENAGHRLGDFRALHEGEDVHQSLDLYLMELTTVRGEGGRIDKMADMVGYYSNVKWRSWVELNPETARELGLQNHQNVWVESPHGRLQMRLYWNEGLMPGVAAVPAGLGKSRGRPFGVNINTILSPVRDCLTGAPARAETKVRVYASA